MARCVWTVAPLSRLIQHGVVRAGFSSSLITGRVHGWSGCQPLGTSGGLGFPPTRHLNGTAGHQLLLLSARAVIENNPVVLARQSALISNSKTTKKIFVPEDCLLWLLCCFFLFVFEQKSGSGGTITGLALLTACRCIVFGIPLLALGRNWIAVMWCWVRAEWFRLFSAAFVYWGRLGVNINRLCSRGGLDWTGRTDGLEMMNLNDQV